MFQRGGQAIPRGGLWQAVMEKPEGDERPQGEIEGSRVGSPVTNHLGLFEVDGVE